MFLTPIVQHSNLCLRQTCWLDLFKSFLISNDRNSSVVSVMWDNFKGFNSLWVNFFLYVALRAGTPREACPRRQSLSVRKHFSGSGKVKRGRNIKPAASKCIGAPTPVIALSHLLINSHLPTALSSQIEENRSAPIPYTLKTTNPWWLLSHLKLLQLNILGWVKVTMNLVN